MKTFRLFLLLVAGVLLFWALTVSPPPAQAGGGAGNAIDCTPGQYAQVPDANNLDLLTQHTIEVWFKADTMGFLGGLVDKYHNTAANGWMLRLHRNSPYAGLEMDERFSSSSNILGSGRWYHAAGTRNGSTVSLYLNGTPVAMSGTPLTPNNNSNPVVFCVDFLFSGPRFFDGQIEEVRVWNFAMTQAQIQANMHRQLTGTEVGLEGYWKLDEAPGQTITDSSGGNNGFLGANASDASSDPVRVASTAPIGNSTVSSLNNPVGIWYLVNTTASSGGLILANSTFFNAVGDDIIFASDGVANTTTGANLPSGGVWDTAPAPVRWIRTWYLDKTDTGVTGGNVDFTFDFSDAGMGFYTPSGVATNFRLLYRANNGDQFQDVATATSISGDRVIFNNVVTLAFDSLAPDAVADGYYTLATLDNNASPTAITLAGMGILPPSVNTALLIGLFVLLLVVSVRAATRPRI